MKHIFTWSVLFLLPVMGLFSHPDYYLTLRDAIFAQELNADRIAPLYRDAVAKAQETLRGRELYTMLSRCEYMMGRAYQEDQRKDEAIRCYENGVSWAEKANAEAPSADGYEMIASNIGQLCMLRSTFWVMANGLKVEQNAKKGLKLDERHAACMYLIASRWAFGPNPFGNPRRGVTELQAMLNGTADLDRDNYFNIYSGIGYAYLRLENKAEAAVWITRALEIYPTNKFALGLLRETET
ncbi:MAG: tetratricopeptide repeat protein [Treponema sp.]|jgi:tetratricopeptide (TPR) repeat protein|nr:tetratricopeptide repeat protein [Treponema sp.]